MAESLKDRGAHEVVMDEIYIAGNICYNHGIPAEVSLANYRYFRKRAV